MVGEALEERVIAFHALGRIRIALFGRENRLAFAANYLHFVVLGSGFVVTSPAKTSLNTWCGSCGGRSRAAEMTVDILV